MEGEGDASLSKLNSLIEKDSEHKAMEYILKHNITEGELLKKVRTDKSIRCFSPLALASRAGCLDLVKLLIARDFDTRELEYNGEDFENLGPIHYACAAGQVNIVGYFIEEHGFDVASKSTQFGYSLLQTATDRGHLPLVKYLVEAGASVNMEEEKPLYAPLHIAVSGEPDVSLEICRYLISQGADVNSHFGDGFTPLQISTDLGHIPTTRLLLEAGANPNLSDKPDIIPLILAVENESLDMVKLLISHGADLSVKDSYGKSLLQKALSSLNRDNYGLVYYLAMTGAHPLLRNDKFSIIPLEIALKIKNRNAIRLLINFCDLLSERQLFEFLQEYEHLNDMIEFLHECIPCPRTLKDLCCIRIRCSLARQFPSGVEQLCLPRVVKDYLQLKHLSPEAIGDI